MWAIGAASFAVAMAVTLFVTPLVVRLAHALGAVDQPAGRKLHATPMPRIGGVAVFIGFLAGLTFAAAITGALSVVPKVGVYWRGLAIAAAGMFLVGLLDDLKEVSFRWKFAAQIVATAYIWSCGFKIEYLSNPLGGVIDLGWMSLPLTLLWVVGITNAVNLIDGLDGLAAGTAAIMTSAFGMVAIINGKLGVTAACVALAGSLLGFLWFNFNPARIFLGDSGSMFIGFVLAVTSVRGSQKGPAVVAVFVPLLVLGLPLIDTGFALLRRALRLGTDGRRSPNAALYVMRNWDHLFQPDRGHIHHRLLDWGLSHRNTVLVLYGVVTVLVGTAFAFLLLKSLWFAVVLALILVSLFGAFIAMLVAREKRARSAALSTAGGDLPLTSPSAPGD